MGPRREDVIETDHAEVGLKSRRRSRARLDLSVCGLDAVKETVGSWLGVDGSRVVVHQPAHRAVALLSTSDDCARGRGF